MKLNRLVQLLGLITIGDGVIGLLKPRRHSLLWDVGPGPVRHFMEELAAHRDGARAFYGAELALGIWLASAQTPEKSSLF